MTEAVPHPEELRGIAVEAASAAAAIATSWLGDASRLRVEEKAAPDDLVSQADREAERAARGVIARRRPADGVTGEEEGASAPAAAVRWLIDPIDGTTNYLYGRPDWAVSVAATGPDGRVLAAAVLEPMLARSTTASLGGGTHANGLVSGCSGADELARALIELNIGRPAQRHLAGRAVDALVPRVRDVRRGGSAAAALAQVATGRVDGYWGPGLNDWDAAGGLLLVSEAGGAVGTVAGRTEAIWPPGGDVLACAPGIWEDVRALLAGIYGG